MRKIIGKSQLRQALELRDLCDPTQGPHAMQVLLEELQCGLTKLWEVPSRVHRASPVVSVADNYDRLYYPEDGAARDAKYSRYVSQNELLRTQTSAMIPGLLRDIATCCAADQLLLCPGLVYRRDCIDRWHTGEPHQVDLWRIRRGSPLRLADLLGMVESVVSSALPGMQYRCLSAEHPYTEQGLQIDVLSGASWVEVGECGLALPALLDESGLDSRQYSGLAMGLGLDRLLMLVKGIDDIRLLRSPDPRVAKQMLRLEPYQPVSRQPAICRDLSIAVDVDTTPEELGDVLRTSLGPQAEWVESVDILEETEYADLPTAAKARLGINQAQKNVLLRMTLRALTTSIGTQQANRMRDRAYAALHRGSVACWAARR